MQEDDRELVFGQLVKQNDWYRATSAKEPPEFGRSTYCFYFVQVTKSGKVVIQTDELFVHHRHKKVPFSCWLGKRAWASLSGGQQKVRLLVHPRALRRSEIWARGMYRDRYEILLCLSARGTMEALVDEDLVNREVLPR